MVVKESSESILRNSDLFDAINYRYFNLLMNAVKGVSVDRNYRVTLIICHEIVRRYDINYD